MRNTEDNTEKKSSYFSESLSSGAVKPLRSALRADQLDMFWSLWQKTILVRIAPLRLEEIFVQIRWGGYCGTNDKSRTISTDFSNQFRLTQKTVLQQLQNESTETEPEFSVLLDLLEDSLRILLDLRSVSLPLWQEILEGIGAIFTLAIQKETELDGKLASQLIAELAFLWSVACPEWEPFARLATWSKKKLNGGISQILDGHGIPSPNHLVELRYFLACWTRVLLLSNITNRKIFSASVHRQYEWAILQTIRWMRPNGTAVLSSPVKKGEEFSPESLVDLIGTAAKLDDDPNDTIAVQEALTFLTRNVEWKKEWTHMAKEYPDAGLPAASSFSDDSRSAALRSGWRRRQSGCFFVRSGDSLDMKMELFTAGKILLSGMTHTEISFGGLPLQSAGPWESLCEENENAYACFEWALPLTHDLRLERMACIFPEEEVLLLADAILVPEDQWQKPQLLSYRNSWPIANEISFASSGQARELFAKGKKKRVEEEVLSPVASLLPIGMGEWKECEDGTFQAKNGQLTLEYQAKGTGFYIPLFVDLNRNRCCERRNWRPLTIGRDMTDVSGTEAVGYRVEVGTEQYLIYRNFQKILPRTILGHHLISDFLFAKFGKGYGTAPILDLGDRDKQ